MNSLIFDIQRFSIHDGPGIRTVVFFKGCNLQCPWCQNPESMAFKPELAYYADKCINSRDCAVVCPTKAISFSNGFTINRELCNGCGKCADACSADALKIIGKEYSTSDVMKEIMSDVDYYITSGGGVTFSGGEPTLHFDFLNKMLRLCKEQSLHTNIETNGFFSWEKMEQLLPFLDLIYFDLKIMDEESNRAIIAGDSKRIISNMKKLIAHAAPVEFRIPLIPGFTASENNITSIVDLLNECGVKNIHLLPYHNMGESKADKICSMQPKLNLSPFNTEELKGIQDLFETRKINTVLYR